MKLLQRLLARLFKSHRPARPAAFAPPAARHLDLPDGQGVAVRAGRVLCASPDYLAREGSPRTLRDLARHRRLAADGQSPWRLSGVDGPVLFEPRSVVRTNSSEVVRELALAGMGIALRSLWDVHGDLAAGRLVRVLPQWQGQTDVHIHAVTLPGPAPAARVSAFVSYLAALYQPAPPWA